MYIDITLLSRICPSIGRHFKYSVETLITCCFALYNCYYDWPLFVIACDPSHFQLYMYIFSSKYCNLILTKLYRNVP